MAAHEVRVGDWYKLVGGWAEPEHSEVCVERIPDDELVDYRPGVYTDFGYAKKNLFFGSLGEFESSGEYFGYVLIPDALEPTAEMIDPVNSPSHYTQYPVEVIELTEHMNFCRGNAVKYIARAGLKDPNKELEDLHKARWYIEREIARLEA